MDLTGLSGLYFPVLLGYDSVIHTNLAGRVLLSSALNLFFFKTQTSQIMASRPFATSDPALDGINDRWTCRAVHRLCIA